MEGDEGKKLSETHHLLFSVAFTAEAVLWEGGVLAWDLEVYRGILEPGCVWVIPALGEGVRTVSGRSEEGGTGLPPECHSVQCVTTLHKHYCHH